MLDQISKNFIASKLDMNEIFVLNSFINLTHVHNYGAAFSLFSDSININTPINNVNLHIIEDIE